MSFIMIKFQDKRPTLIVLTLSSKLPPKRAFSASCSLLSHKGKSPPDPTVLQIDSAHPIAVDYRSALAALDERSDGQSDGQSNG